MSFLQPAGIDVLNHLIAVLDPLDPVLHIGVDKDVQRPDIGVAKNVAGAAADDDAGALGRVV